MTGPAELIELEELWSVPRLSQPADGDRLGPEVIIHGRRILFGILVAEAYREGILDLCLNLACPSFLLNHVVWGISDAGLASEMEVKAMIVDRLMSGRWIMVKGSRRAKAMRGVKSYASESVKLDAMLRRICPGQRDPKADEMLEREFSGAGRGATHHRKKNRSGRQIRNDRIMMRGGLEYAPSGFALR